MKDYRERKPVGKNRPKKQPIGLYVTVALGTALPTFALGILAGWFLFRTDPAVIQKQVAVQVAKELAKSAPAHPGDPQGAIAPSGPAPEPSLSFYETLPKGGRAALGSGLNPAKPEGHPAAKPSAGDVPATKQPAAPKPTTSAAASPAAPAPAAAAPAKEGAHQEAASPANVAKKAPGKGTFTVQAASYQDRNEAEELRARIAAKGHAAYIVESTVPGKGVWYRIKVGKHLDEAAAKELAGKLGKTSMVVPE